MKDNNNNKSKEQLLDELHRLRREVSRLNNETGAGRIARETGDHGGVAGKESGIQLRMIVEALPDVVLTLDGEGRYLRVLAQRDGLLAARPDALEGKRIHDIIPRDIADQCVAVIDKTIHSGEGQIVEYELDVIEGHKWFEGRTSPLKEPDGSINKVLWIARDVTERHLADEQIKTTLKEKELLLREIYHRVRNNLQIISSILKLQAGYLTDRETRELFRQSQNRITSMAIIHELLYRSDNFTNVDFERYIRALADHLYFQYSVDRGKITLKTDVRDVLLGINTAIPCGLLINELLSSCFIHSFPGGSEGMIHVTMQRTPDNRIELLIKTNGRPFPEAVDDTSVRSFTLELVNTLAKQLGGRLEIEQRKWVQFKIIFPER